MNKVKNIAIFASGSGTNAENIIRYFQGSPTARVVLLLSNNPEAGALDRARNLGVDTCVFTREEMLSSAVIEEQLGAHEVDIIILAGFLWLLPARIAEAYPGRVLNIHPALLPAYGGKGMYGMRVHSAVIAAGEKMSGITIHKVDECYDRGDIIAQFTVEIADDDTPESLAEKIHRLEYRHFPAVIERLAAGL